MSLARRRGLSLAGADEVGQRSDGDPHEERYCDVDPGRDDPLGGQQ